MYLLQTRVYASMICSNHIRVMAMGRRVRPRSVMCFFYLVYSTSSLYRTMTSGGVRDSQMTTVRKCNIPLKVKIIIWMAAHDRSQSRVQLKKKNW